MAGFIRLSRKYFEHSFWQIERTYSLAEAWLDLIASARFEQDPEKLIVGMKSITINRGELRASLRYLAVRWKWSIGKVRRFISLLESESMITTKTEHKETIITILNYNKFNTPEKQQQNSDEHINGNENDTLTEQLRNSDGTVTEQTKEREEYKESKESLFRQRFFSVLEIFYFKNFKNPVAVANAFFNHYEGVGWKNARGLDIENVESVAENWDNKTTEGANCPEALLTKWKVMYHIIRNNSDKQHMFLLIRPGKLENGTLFVRGKLKDIEAIENDEELKKVWKNALFMSFGKVSIQYEIDKTVAA